MVDINKWPSTRRVIGNRDPEAVDTCVSKYLTHYVSLLVV